MRHRTAHTLARQAALAYAVLIVYASLHPFSGWRPAGGALADFLFAALPRYLTAFDLVINVLAYMPLGFLLVPSFQTRMKRGWAVVAACVVGATLSCGMELLQNFLPSRVPSNLDLMTNALGTALGALAGARWGAIFADRGWLALWRRRRIVRSRLGDTGLVLLAVWLFTQTLPRALFLGNGDLRGLLDLPAPVSFSPGSFLALEFLVTLFGVLAAGLLAWRTMREPSAWLVALLLAAAVVVRAFSSALQIDVESFAHWVTPGNAAGFAVGALALTLAVRLPAWVQHTLAGLALLAATALVNLGPENPYTAQALSTLSPGHFLNFNGLTRLASVLWPFAALAYLMALGARRTD